MGYASLTKVFMHEFLKEYGPFIIAAVAILILITIITASQGTISDAFNSLLDTFLQKANSQI